MAVVVSNEKVAASIYIMTITEPNNAKPGQFYMLKTSDTLTPFLPRPISVHDADENHLVFLYQLKGSGTELLSKMKKDDEICVAGPYGNGFAFEDEDITFVGGGIGIAPIYYALKLFKSKYPNRAARVFLGFANESYCSEKFRDIADCYCEKIGEIITENVDYALSGALVSCGPEAMMRDVYERAKACNPDKKVFVSLESYMACGVGACRGCSRRMKGGMKRVCADGPVFDAAEVFYE